MEFFTKFETKFYKTSLWLPSFETLWLWVNPGNKEGIHKNVGSDTMIKYYPHD